MDDLTGQYEASPAPTSQSPGNTVADRPDLAMTAPGSEPVNPVPDVVDSVPNPKLGAQRGPTVMVHGQGEGFAGTWQDASESGAGWKQL
jgi:hypothetical protein